MSVYAPSGIKTELVNIILEKKSLKYMTKSEFIGTVPGLLTHKTWGEGVIEIVADTNAKKGVCYRHRNNIASCGTYASTWLELHDKFKEHLIREGYINPNSS